MPSSLQLAHNVDTIFSLRSRHIVLATPKRASLPLSRLQGRLQQFAMPAFERAACCVGADCRAQQRRPRTRRRACADLSTQRASAHCAGIQTKEHTLIKQIAFGAAIATIALASGLAQAADATGTIRSWSEQNRQLVLDNGTTYTLNANVPLTGIQLSPGQRVTLSFDTNGNQNMVTRLVPAAGGATPGGAGGGAGNIGAGGAGGGEPAGGPRDAVEGAR